MSKLHGIIYLRLRGIALYNGQLGDADYWFQKALGLDLCTKDEVSESFGDKDSLSDHAEQRRKIVNNNEDTECDVYDSEGAIAVLDSIMGDL